MHDAKTDFLCVSHSENKFLSLILDSLRSGETGKIKYQPKYHFTYF